MKFRLALAFGSVVLIAAAFVLNTVFLRTVLSDGYQVAEIKRFLISTEAAVDTIEKLLANKNKRLSVAEMTRILDRQRQAINRYWGEMEQPEPDAIYRPGKGLVDIAVVLKSGSKWVTTTNEDPERELPADLQEQIAGISNGRPLGGLGFVDDNEHYYLPYPVIDDQDRWVVTLVFQFRKEALRYAVAPRLDEHLRPTMVIGMFSVFGILFLGYQLGSRGHVIRKKRFIFGFVLILVASLVSSLLVNTVIFERQILDLSVKNARETATEIAIRLGEQESMRKPGLASGGPLPGFSDTFFLFDNFETITLSDSRGQPVYSHGTERKQGFGIGSAIQTAVIGQLPEKQFRVLEKFSGTELEHGPGWTAAIQISKASIFRNSLSTLINGITILFITTLVAVECLLLYLHLHLHLVVKKNTGIRKKSRYKLGFVRPAMFLFLLAIDLSLSILPLHMQTFDSELFGLSRDIVLGLPVSAEFLCVGISILMAGVWMDRRGWHEPFFIGLFVVLIGSLCSWASPNAPFFILSRALVGVGYGLSLMSAQGLIIKFCEVDERARGFAGLFAGLYSGSICGAAAGAIFAERYGYEKVFLVGAVMVLLLIFFTWVFLRSAIEPHRRDARQTNIPEQGVRHKALLKFIGNPVFIALSILSSLPASIAVAGFLHFFTPVYMDQIGARESTIGQVLILYGICLIYFGPRIARLIDRSQKKKYYMLAGGVLGGLAFTTFDASFGVASMVVSIFLLGLSSSFVLSSQSTIVLEMKESRILGEGTALGIFRSISRVGQVVGPVIFGWVLLSGNLTEAIKYLGYTYIGAMLILAIFVKHHTGNLENQKPAFQK